MIIQAGVAAGGMGGKESAAAFKRMHATLLEAADPESVPQHPNVAARQAQAASLVSSVRGPQQPRRKATT